MRKTLWIGVLLLLTLLLGACGQQTAAPTDAPTEPEAASPVMETKLPEVQETEEVVAAVAQCQPYNLLDQILAAPDINLAAVTEDDWAKGPADAKITLLEFSDFQ